MADKLVSIWAESNFRFSYQHIAFDNAGHRLGRLSKPNDTFVNSGTEEGNLQAHARTKVRVKIFFDKSLR